MYILVINSGSSSLKYQLFDMTYEEVLASGIVERIGQIESVFKHIVKSKVRKAQEKNINTHKEALKLVLNILIDGEYGVLNTIDEINAIGHRIVHAGEFFSQSVLVDDQVLETLEKTYALAPLHNPANIMGIKACKEIMPNTPQVVVFDTAFHQTMEPAAYLYAIPYEYYEKYKIRKYGFHGTSHKYVYYKAAKILDKDINNFKAITCHIGNGCSVAAIKNGKVVDTSMGFTPLEGLVMGTRCGDIDPAVLVFLMQQEKLTANEIEDILNKKSGVYGICGASDLRDVEDKAEKGDLMAQYALDIYVHRIIKYIGAYLAILNGVDAIIFTAGVGENSDVVRKMVSNNLKWLGVNLDEEKNKVRGKEEIISKENSSIKLLVVPTNEEYMIAKDTYEIINNNKL